MKALLVNTLYAPMRFGGVERMVQSLAETLVGFGHEVVVVTTSNGADRTRSLNGVRIHDVRLRNVYPLFPVGRRQALLKPLWHTIDTTNPLMAARLADILDREAPDLIHTHNLTGFSTLSWKSAAERGVPIVHTLHDYYLLCLRSTMFHGGKPRDSAHFPCSVFSRPRVRRAKLVSAVVGVSRFVLDMHLRNGAFRGASVQRVIQNPSALSSAAAETPRDQGATLRIGYLGRLEPIKGVDVLLDAVAGLPPGGWTLEIAGQAEEGYLRQLRAHATSGPVQFSGSVDPEDFFRRIDLLVVPSRADDTFGMVIVEAYAFGIPVVVSRRGGMPEIVDEGSTGFVVDPDRPDELRRVLARLIATPGSVSSMREQCRAAAARFDPARIARQYEELYDLVRSAPQAPAAPPAAT